MIPRSPKQEIASYNATSSTLFLSSNSAHTPKQNIIITKPLGRVDGNEKPPPRVRRQSHNYRVHSRAYHHEPYPSPPTSRPLSPQLARLPPSSFMKSQIFWLALYFAANLGLTLHNKLVLVRFPFPYILTAVHTLMGAIGAAALARHGFFRPVQLNCRESAVLFAFSLLYTMNIAISNVSLQLVTVAFHQVVRAATPIFTIVFCKLFLGTTSSHAKWISLAPVIIGVGLATYGDYYFTSWGLFLTLIGTILAAIKTILTNVLQTPSDSHPHRSDDEHHSQFNNRLISLPSLHPLALLYLLSPLAFVECVLLSYLSGELEQVSRYVSQDMSPTKFVAVLLNGCLAFILNVVSFSANKKVGALSMTVAANVKQALTILFGVLAFNLTLTRTNVVGILLTILGGASYGWVEYLEAQPSRK